MQADQKNREYQRGWNLRWKQSDKGVRFNIPMTYVLRNGLGKLAASRGISSSAFIREVIADMMEKELGIPKSESLVGSPMSPEQWKERLLKWSDENPPGLRRNWPPTRADLGDTG